MLFQIVKIIITPYANVPIERAYKINKTKRKGPEKSKLGIDGLFIVAGKLDRLDKDNQISCRYETTSALTAKTKDGTDACNDANAFKCNRSDTGTDACYVCILYQFSFCCKNDKI